MAKSRGGYNLHQPTDRNAEDRYLRSLKWQRDRLLREWAKDTAAAQHPQQPEPQRSQYRALAQRRLTVDLPRISRRIAQQEEVCARAAIAESADTSGIVWTEQDSQEIRWPEVPSWAAEVAQ